MTIRESRSPRVGRAVDRLSRGLLAYEIVGLAVSLIGVGALLWLGGRVTYLSGEAEATMTRLATTTELSARVLRDAAVSARRFGGTLDQSAQAVSSAALTITEVRSGLSAFEGQLRSVNILGAAPLSSSADAIGRVAATMNGLDTRLKEIGDGLKGNEAALADNATSLDALAASIGALGAGLSSTLGQDVFGDLKLVIVALMLVWAAWSLVPAAGALALGLWLRKELRSSGWADGRAP